MKLAVYSRLLKTTDIPSIQLFLEEISKRSEITLTYYLPYLEQLIDASTLPGGSHESFENFEDIILQKVDYFVSLGGDGTILDTPAFVRDSNIPVIGINIGRLGFLSSIEKDNIVFALDSIQKGDYYIEDRILLHLNTERKLFGNKNFALNDCTISKRDTSSMIIIHSYIDGKFLNSYWADGIIISTPTGSTGYSLSCGGPIVSPGTANIVITPVAPHNLNVRPIIISDSCTLELEIEGRADNYLCTLDSRHEVVHPNERLTIRKNDFSIKLLRLSDIDFYQTIRSKLAWGSDSRNSKY